jgi:hypothetical protein
VVHLNDLYRRFKGRAAFAFVGTREAGHHIPGFEHLVADQNARGDDHWFKGRCGRVAQAQRQAGLSLPGYLDRPDQAAVRPYAPWPGRLVVVGINGRILRDFGAVVGPGWKFDEVTAVLEAECARAAARRNGLESGT